MAKKKEPSLLKTISEYFDREKKKTRKQTSREVIPSLDTTFIFKSFEKVKKNSDTQLQIVKKTNIAVTQISDNIYNIAAKIGAQLTSFKEVEESLKEQTRLEQLQKQQNIAASEEAAMETRQAIPQNTEAKQEKLKQDSMFDTLKKGFKLPFKDIIKTVFSGGMSFLKKAGGFLLRGLTLFTNPIGLAVAVIGTIGYGIYKYFTDKEFRGSVNNIFQTTKDFVAEKFSQAQNMFGEYIVSPVVNFLSIVRDKFIDGLIGLIKAALPDLPVFKSAKESIIQSLSGFKSKETQPTKTEIQIPPGTSTAGAGRGSINPPMAVPDQDIPTAQDTQPSITEESPLDVDIKKYVNLKDSSINLDGLDQAVKKRLAAVAYEYYNATGQKIQINSAFRDPKEQEELFKKYGSPRAAKPGKSKHEVGLAFDINSGDANKAIAMGLFDKYGFHRPFNAESWHIEPTEIKNSVPDNPVNPGQAVLVSNEGKATVPSDGKPINEGQLKQAIPSSSEQTTNTELATAEPVHQPSVSPSVVSSGSQEPATNQTIPPSSPGIAPSSSQVQQVQPAPSTGENIVTASINVEGQYFEKQSSSVTNIDNSTKNVANSQERPRFVIPSPVANRGSLDKYSYSLT